MTDKEYQVKLLRNLDTQSLVQKLTIAACIVHILTNLTIIAVLVTLI